jgi:hypothetical protein
MVHIYNISTYLFWFTNIHSLQCACQKMFWILRKQVFYFVRNFLSMLSLPCSCQAFSDCMHCASAQAYNDSPDLDNLELWKNLSRVTSGMQFTKHCQHKIAKMWSFCYYFQTKEAKVCAVVRKTDLKIKHSLFIWRFTWNPNWGTWLILTTRLFCLSSVICT